VKKDPDLRLTPTTLRRVIQQRDKLEENNLVLKEENDKLKLELLEHLKCSKIIQDSKELVITKTEQYSKIEKEYNDYKINKELELKELNDKFESLTLAYNSSEKMNNRNINKTEKLIELEEKLKIISDKYIILSETHNKLIKEQNDLNSSLNNNNNNATLTPEDFFNAIENFKMDSLMACISERVFIHVVAPRTILQIGSPQHNNTSNNTNNNKQNKNSSHAKNQKEFSPNIPSDLKINNFIKNEIEPHFQMIFKTLEKIDPKVSEIHKKINSSSSSTSNNQTSSTATPCIDEQLSPDGTSVKTYAEKFNLSLSSFIKKCIQDS